MAFSAPYKAVDHSREAELAIGRRRNATLSQLLGFDHKKLTYRYAGRDFRLTDVHGDVVKALIG